MRVQGNGFYRVGRVQTIRMWREVKQVLLSKIANVVIFSFYVNKDYSKNG